MSELWLRRMMAAVLAAGLLHCSVAAAQEAQTEKPAPPIHLLTGKQAVLPVTVQNNCPQQESFSVTTDGLPGSLVRAVEPISIGANSSGNSVLIVNTTGVAPGLYGGNIVVACVTCGAECKQDRTLFPLQLQVDRDASGATPNGESKVATDGPAASGPGTRTTDSALQENQDVPGKKPEGGGPQQNPTTPGTQPGQTPAGGGEKTSGGNGPVAPLGGGNTPPVQAPPTPGTGMGQDDGLPLPKRPKGLTANTTTCPCHDICDEAAEDEWQARQILADYLKYQAYADLLESQWRALIDQAQADDKEADAAKAMNEPEEVRQLTADAAAARAQAATLVDELSKAQAKAASVGAEYHTASAIAGIARLKCDDCLAQHPECPASLRVQSDTTGNPPTTNAPGTTTASGGGTNPPPTGPPPTHPPPTQEKPKEPTPTTPGDDPTIHKPPDAHTPGGGNFYGHDQTAQCPQLHNGCIALVADLMKNDATTLWFKQQKKKAEEDLKKSEAELDTAKEGEKAWRKKNVEWLKEQLQTGYPVDYASELKSAGCKVFAPDPAIDLQPITFKETLEELKAIEVHNEAEMYRLNGVITQYRLAVATGQPQIAIEIVNAHGGPAIAKNYDGNDYERCGEWGTDYYTGTRNDLFRASFHNGNYAAANKNVCNWFNVDLSCYGGLTPKVVDELNNYATSTCQKGSTIDCALHAGWSGDGSFSSGTSVAPCHYGDSLRNGNLLRQMIDDHLASAPAAGGGPPDFQWLTDGLKRIERGGTAYYSDHGYAQDVPPVHTHFGYPAAAPGAPCAGGQCAK